MPLTLREVLDLEVVRRGEPRVMAAADRLDAPVRWVHAIELTDVERLLRGGHHPRLAPADDLEIEHLAQGQRHDSSDFTTCKD